MDFLFLCLGAVCLAEGIDLFFGKDFLMFIGDANKDDYDAEKVFAVEKWLFLIDGICSFVIGLNWFSGTLEWVILGIFAVTLVIHTYVFKSRRFRKKG
jgi:hypothetical protein